MGTKRPPPASDDSSHRPNHKRPKPTTNMTNPSKPTTTNPPRRHRPHRPQPPGLTNPLGPHSFKKAHRINPLKSQIRSLRRLLTAPAASEALPATVRREKERALRTAEEDLAREVAAQKRGEVIGRWHKVRFFERQRAERRLRRVRKEEGGEEMVRDAETDLNYARFFPLHVDYVPLWPTRKGEKEVREVKLGEREGDLEMWELVRKCMEDGTLEDLREGRLMGGRGDENDQKKKKKKDEEVDDGDDSGEDGAGFFE